MEKFINEKSLPIIVVSVVIGVGFVFQSNFFATRLQLEQLRNEVLQQKLELQQYSDANDQEVIKQIDAKYDKIMEKLEKLGR